MEFVKLSFHQIYLPYLLCINPQVWRSYDVSFTDCFQQTAVSYQQRLVRLLTDLSGRCRTHHGFTHTRRAAHQSGAETSRFVGKWRYKYLFIWCYSTSFDRQAAPRQSRRCGRFVRVPQKRHRALRTATRWETTWNYFWNISHWSRRHRRSLDLFCPRDTVFRPIEHFFEFQSVPRGILPLPQSTVAPQRVLNAAARLVWDLLH